MRRGGVKVALLVCKRLRNMMLWDATRMAQKKRRGGTPLRYNVSSINRNLCHFTRILRPLTM